MLKNFAYAAAGLAVLTCTGALILAGLENTAHAGNDTARVTYATDGTPLLNHRVRPGDNLYRLSQVYYDDARLWHIIADANAITDPTAVQAGSVLRIPPRPVEFAPPVVADPEPEATVSQVPFAPADDVIAGAAGGDTIAASPMTLEDGDGNTVDCVAMVDECENGTTVRIIGTDGPLAGQELLRRVFSQTAGRFRFLYLTDDAAGRGTLATVWQRGDDQHLTRVFALTDDDQDGLLPVLVRETPGDPWSLSQEWNSAGRP